MFTDSVRQEVHDRLRQHDLRADADQLTPGVFFEAARRAGLRIGACPLNLVNLVWLGIATAWRKRASFVTILTVTLQLLQDQEHFAQSDFGKDWRRQQRQARHRAAKRRKKHDPHSPDPTQVSEEAFVQARQRMPLSFWLELLLILGERLEAETSYAELKTEQRLEGGLLRKPPAGIAYEVAGHMVWYLLVRWLIVEAAVAHGLDPLRISFRSALRELQNMWSTLVTSSPGWVAQVLLPRLLERMALHAVPYRPGRSYPRT